MTDPLARLAALHGVAPVWHDMDGAEHRPGPETQRALLQAMGVPCASPAEIAGALAEAEAQDTGPLPADV